MTALAGCGSSETKLGSGPVRWTRLPVAGKPRLLASDRVVVGEVRNSSTRTLALDARKVLVRDASGRSLVSSARFVAGYTHPLYGVFQQPRFHERSELTRLGVIHVLGPGGTSPLYVAYRLLPSSKPPITATIVPGPPLPLPLEAAPGR